MQRVITDALSAAERREPRTTAQLRLSPGAEGRVVVLWRRVIVGFVPPAEAAQLRHQLADVGRSPLVTDGHVLRHEGLWRIWAGPGEPPGPPPPARPGELQPPPLTILGIPLRGRGSGGPPPSSRTNEAAPAPVWILAVGTESWEVRDGTDVDLALLRRRVAEAAPGDTVHLRIWEQTVSMHLTPEKRVTLTDPTGALEQLHPR